MWNGHVAVRPHRNIDMIQLWKTKTLHIRMNGSPPDLILNLLEAQGYACDGRLLALNSYENRVYQIGIEDETPVIAKFYRPGRWNKDSILEEHAFAIELSEHEIPVIAPLKNTAGGNTSRVRWLFIRSLHSLRGTLA